MSSVASMPSVAAMEHEQARASTGALRLVANAVGRIPWAGLVCRLGRLLLLPLGLLARSLASTGRTLLFVLRPLLCIFSFLLACLAAALSLLHGLQPLYIFFGVAAILGLVFGLTVGLTSSLITGYLHMYDEPFTSSETFPQLQDHAPDRKQKAVPLAALESDWYWAESSSSYRRRRASGLLSQTIHEEDNDSDF